MKSVSSEVTIKVALRLQDCDRDAPARQQISEKEASRTGSNDTNRGALVPLSFLPNDNQPSSLRLI